MDYARVSQGLVDDLGYAALSDVAGDTLPQPHHVTLEQLTVFADGHHHGQRAVGFEQAHDHVAGP